MNLSEIRKKAQLEKVVCAGVSVSAPAAVPAAEAGAAAGMVDAAPEDFTIPEVAEVRPPLPTPPEEIPGQAFDPLALLLAGGIWLSLHYTRVIAENQLAAETTRAYNQADIARCGDGQLCAHVDLKAKRFGDQGQYVPIRPR